MLQQQSESMAANAPLDLSFYHRTETLLGRLTQMAQADQCGRRMAVENLHDEQDPSFQLPVFTFGDHATLTAQTPHRTAKVLLNFGAHGRELISSEVALRLARMLCGEAPSRFYGPSDRSRDRIAELLKVSVIKMVPVQVPSSRKLAETASDTCRRRRLNARGVDVNRNWNASWTDGEDYASSDQFRGPQPFSEPETRSLANLAAAWRPDIYVDVHSGETYLATPYASKLQGVSDRAHRAALRGVVQAVTHMMQGAHPDAIPAGGLPNGPASSLGEEPYRASGTSLDYMYSQLGIARSFMFEVYGAASFIGGDRQRRVLRPPSNLLLLLNTNPADADADADADASKGAAAGAVVAAAAATMSPPRLMMLAPSRRRRSPLDFFGVWGGRRDASDAQARRVLASATSLLAAQPLASAPPLAAQDDANFDCVGYFNPVAQADYERTVDAWADALLVVVNQSTLTMEEASRQ